MKTTTKSGRRVETVKGRAARALLGAWLSIFAGSASAWCEWLDTAPPRWFCTAPSVSITSPANGTIYTSPASFPVTATVNNQGQPITKVDFYVNGAVFQTVTTAPYSVTYTPPAPGTYTFKAAATETNQGTRTRISTEVTITVQSGVAQIYYIHPDHLNTPRLIADATGTTVWRWDQGEPFGNDVPNNNPSGAGTFDFPLRFPGQYFDRETNLAYNYHRNYSSDLGRYVEADPIGIRGSINIYAYVDGRPLAAIDPLGLLITIPFPPLPSNGNLWPGTSPQNFICEFPTDLLLENNPCTQRCCVRHDECFARNSCNWSSWFGTVLGFGLPCNRCNSEAARCVWDNWGKTSCPPGCGTGSK